MIERFFRSLKEECAWLHLLEETIAQSTLPEDSDTLHHARSALALWPAMVLSGPDTTLADQARIDILRSIAALRTAEAGPDTGETGSDTDDTHPDTARGGGDQPTPSSTCGCAASGLLPAGWLLLPALLHRQRRSRSHSRSRMVMT